MVKLSGTSSSPVSLQIGGEGTRGNRLSRASLLEFELDPGRSTAVAVGDDIGGCDGGKTVRV